MCLWGGAQRLRVHYMLILEGVSMWGVAGSEANFNYFIVVLLVLG